MTLPLYRRLLGASFDTLPARVRELHDLKGPSVWVGRADVERGTSLAARFAAALTSLPPTGHDQPLRISFEPRNGAEIWSRQFGRSVFCTVQSARGDRLCEHVWPGTFVFALVASPDGLALKLHGLRVLGVPMPRPLHPAIVTLESEREGRYRFDVEARLPLFGLLVRYAGWLERAAEGVKA
jgi:hypothetical protein